MPGVVTSALLVAGASIANVLTSAGDGVLCGTIVLDVCTGLPATAMSVCSATAVTFTKKLAPMSR